MARASPAAPAPLSFAQERLWFLDRMEPASGSYNVPAVFHLRGRLDVAALEAALVGVVERHEALRTRFELGEDGPVQIVGPATGFELRQIDLGADEAPGMSETHDVDDADDDPRVEALVRRLSNRPFDLAAGEPFRAVLIRRGANDHVLSLVLHHIVSDGWSLRVLFREVAALYTARVAGELAAVPRLPRLPVQVGDHAAWQRGWLVGERLERGLSFWRRELAGIEPLELPTDRPRPAVQTVRGAARPVHLEASLTRELEALGRRVGATPFMVLSALFATLLSRLSGQRDLTLGTPVAHRTRRETEPLIGLFANTLVLRVDLGASDSEDGTGGDGPGFEALVGRVRHRSLALFAHQEVPFEKIVEELRPARDLARSPLFQVMFALQNARGGGVVEDGEASPRLPGLEVELLRPRIEATRFELTLSVTTDARGVVGGLEYNRDLFDPSTIDRMIGQLATLAAGAVAAPERPVARLALMAPAERRQMLATWDRSPVPVAATVPERIAARAAETPEAPAVACGDITVSYRQLLERADRLARSLLHRGAGPGDRVGICLGRSVDTVVAMLAVLRARAAYVPLDPSYPAERLAYMLDDSGARLLLASEETVATLDPVLDGSTEDREIVLLGTSSAEGASSIDLPTDRPMPGPDDLAYVIYTSGSTGRPKGVEISHRSLTAFLDAMIERPGLSADDVLVAVTTLSFDIAGLELFGPLLVGGRVVVARPEETMVGRSLDALLGSSGATVMQATPITWRLLLEAGGLDRAHPELKALSGGEALPPDLARSLVPRVASLWNLYGPTETTVWSTVDRVEGVTSDAVGVPIGGPIAGTRLVVADALLQAVPPGVPGELLIGGAGVARGYHGRPARTAAAFVPDPYGAESGGRLYRTGDLVRGRPDGRFDFLGRIDTQVKVRGHRIELGEIEAALAAHPEIDRVAVAVEGSGAGARLVAHLVPSSDGGSAPALQTLELRAFLRRRLPTSMVPSVFVALDALPLTPNGKVDRKALRDLAADHDPTGLATRLDGHREHQEPRTETERRVAELWRHLLNVERVGAQDDFFVLGGHSLLLVQLDRRLHRELGVRVSMVDLFRHSTVEALAAHLDRRRS